MTTYTTCPARLNSDDVHCDGCRCSLDKAIAYGGYCPTCAHSYLATSDRALAEPSIAWTLGQLDALLLSGLALDEHPLGALLAADLLGGG